MQIPLLTLFNPIVNYEHDQFISLPEQNFFQDIDSIEQRIKTSTGKWILLSHCHDQVLGFDNDLKAVDKLNQIADQYQDRVLIVVISVNKFELSDLIHYYFFPEYHAVYWPLYKDMTPTYRLNDVTHKYLCLNKRGDPWRQLLYKKFWKQDLLKHSHFSYLCEDDNFGTLFHEPTWEANCKWADEDFIPRFMPSLEGAWPEDKFLELPNDTQLEQYKSRKYYEDGEDDPTWTTDLSLSLSTFCTIVVETDITNKMVNISEKTIRALALGQPMLLLGVSGTHQYLKDLGFDLLDDIIDNSFDQEPETYARFCMFSDSIDKINTHSTGALHHTKCSVKDRLRANRTKVEELHTQMNKRSKEIIDEVLLNFNKHMNIDQ
jgi:hypothetical protein